MWCVHRWACYYSLPYSLETGSANSSDPPVSLPLSQCQGCRGEWPWHLAFYTGDGNFNLGPHACVASVLTSSPPLSQGILCILYVCMYGILWVIGLKLTVLLPQSPKCRDYKHCVTMHGSQQDSNPCHLKFHVYSLPVCVMKYYRVVFVLNITTRSYHCSWLWLWLV